MRTLCLLGIFQNSYTLSSVLFGVTLTEASSRSEEFSEPFSSPFVLASPFSLFEGTLQAHANINARNGTKRFHTDQWQRL